MSAGSNAEGDAVFFFRYEKAQEAICTENTVFIYDSPFWDEDEAEDDGVDGQDTGGSELQEERLSLSALRERLQDLSECSIPVSCLSLAIEEQDSWREIDIAIWTAFCKVIQGLLPGIKKVKAEEPHNLGDDKLKVILQHLPLTLSRLSLESIGGDLPLTYKQIGVSLSHLRTLFLTGCGPRTAQTSTFSKISGENLAVSLEQLTSLHSVAIAGFVTENPEACWMPLVRAIRNNHRLEEVYCIGGFYQVEVGLRTFSLGESAKRALQFGPVLNRAKKECLSAEVFTLKDFVEALIRVRDRIDCLDHLLSITDPNLYAWKAIEPAQSDG